MHVGTVREVRRYPVKSMQGESLSRSPVSPMGLPGDRAYAVRDPASGAVQGGKKIPLLMQCAARFAAEPLDAHVAAADVTLPDGTQTRTDAPDVDARLSALFGHSVTLFTAQATAPGSHFDAAPIHLVTTATLSHFGRLSPEAKFDVRRFRPNFVVETPSGTTGLVEASWVGKTVCVGDVELEIVADCPRCSMTIQAVGELPQDPSILRAIVQHAEQNLGVYAIVKTSGTVNVGDAVSVQT